MSGGSALEQILAYGSSDTEENSEGEPDLSTTFSDDVQQPAVAATSSKRPSSDTKGAGEPDLPTTLSDDEQLQQPAVAATPGKRPWKRTLEKNEKREKRRSNRSPILKDCGCRAVCCGKIGRERRSAINSWFWELSGTEQKSFVLQFSKRGPINRRRGETLRREFTYTYLLEDERGVPQDVCCAFFLNTLGYSLKSRFVCSLE